MIDVFFDFDIIGRLRTTSRSTGLLPKIAFNAISCCGKKEILFSLRKRQLTVYILETGEFSGPVRPWGASASVTCLGMWRVRLLQLGSCRRPLLWATFAIRQLRLDLLLHSLATFPKKCTLSTFFFFFWCVLLINFTKTKNSYWFCSEWLVSYTGIFGTDICSVRNNSSVQYDNDSCRHRIGRQQRDWCNDKKKTNFFSNVIPL